MKYQNEFNFTEALERGRVGMELALGAATSWEYRANQWLSSKPPGFEFTTDDLTSAINMPENGHPNAVGAWTGAKAKALRIIWTGRIHRSKRVSCHAAIQKVWRVI
jgi:hypothetical protein